MGPGMLKSSSSPGPWKSRTHEEEISYPFTYSKAFIVLRCGEEKILCLQSCVFGMVLPTVPTRSSLGKGGEADGNLLCDARRGGRQEPSGF